MTGLRDSLDIHFFRQLIPRFQFTDDRLREFPVQLSEKIFFELPMIESDESLARDKQGRIF